jgi:hypothetical protein
MNLLSVLYLSTLMATAAALNCMQSDNRLIFNKMVLCKSLGGCQSSNVSALGDWPSQVIYMRNLLTNVVDSDTCLNTTVARDIIKWLEVTNVSLSPWWYTWYDFQVQYYDMPRLPGTRIESPATLGRKCYGFAYLKDAWEGKNGLRADIVRTKLLLSDFIHAYDNAIPLTMNICNKVMANCFVNATYSPGVRNGTCPEKVDAFYVGFQWENLGNGLRNSTKLDYPFPIYTGQTTKWEDDVTFAVNVAVNEII